MTFNLWTSSGHEGLKRRLVFVILERQEQVSQNSTPSCIPVAPPLTPCIFRQKYS